MSLDTVRDMPMSEFLQWEMYLRDNGQMNVIIMQAAMACIQMQTPKRVRIENIFSHMKPKPSTGEVLAAKIRMALGLAPLPTD